MNMDEVLKALSNPARLQMMEFLKKPEDHVTDQLHPLEFGICAGQFERCGLSQSTVSAHLAILQRAELVTSNRVGQWIFYKRNGETIDAFLRQIGALI